MVNPRLDLLTDYPFQRLTALLQGKPGAEPLVMSIGEPQHRPPAFVAEILAAESAGWGKYPPMAGSPDFRKAAGGWLMRRFGLAEGTFDPDSQLIPLAGTREGLYQIAQLVVPDSMTNAKPGAKPPVVLLPKPASCPITPLCPTTFCRAPPWPIFAPPAIPKEPWPLWPS